MDKSIKYNLVEDVKHQSTLADIPLTKVHILKSAPPELEPGKTPDQLAPTSTSVVELQSDPGVTRINQSWRTSGPTGAGLNTSEDKWGDQLLLTFNSVSSGGGGSVVQGKQSFIVLIS